VEELKQLLDYIEGYSASVWITLCGVAFGFICLRSLYTAQSAADRPRWAVLGAVSCIFIICSAQGLNWWHSNARPVTTPKAAFNALKENKRVEWLIRLIPYSRTNEGHLSIHELKTLGPPEDKFVFVADYDELKNLTVADAVYKSGLSLAGKDSVSAIIFPVNRRTLYPANVRGVLQVLSKVDAEKKGTDRYTAFNFSAHLDSTPLKALAEDRIFSWSWDSYSIYYTIYERSVEAARRENASGFKFIGKLAKDWHPLGYSQNLEKHADDTEPNDFSLLTKDGTKVEVPNFGARAFFLENLTLSKISDIALIHFDNPDKDRIPDFGGRRGEVPPF